jgi:serine/threonine-protein kinase
VLPEEQNLWADTYDRPMTDVLIMYNEIAQTIADKTQVNLTYEEMTRLTSASQVNPESYDAYLKGLPHLNRATQEELKIALQYFDLALEIDPNNALAHVGVSGVWGIRYQFNMVQRQEAVPLITTAIEKALEIDNTLADAHAALAASKCFHEWDWEGAEKEFQQALRLNPNLADAHVSYSHLLCITGRTKEALAHSELAIELDPLNPLNYVFYGMVLTYNRRPDDAMAASRKVREIDPNLRENLAASADRLWREGKYDEALTIYRKVLADDAEATAALEDGFKKAGHKGAARAVADLFAERYGKPGNSIRAQGIADVYFQAGDYNLTIDWLEKAYEEHEPAMPYIGNPDYDPLRSYPRFQELLRKMNLPVDEKE